MGLITIPNLSGIRQGIVSSPTVDNTCRLSGYVPKSCPEIISLVKSKSANDFLNVYMINSEGIPSSNIYKNLESFHSDLTANNMDQLQVLDGNTDYKKSAEYVTYVENSVLPVLRVANQCILEKNGDWKSMAYKKQREDTDESKLRLDLIKGKDINVSYYEGQFPFSPTRPLQETSLFILFGLSIFLLLISVLIFLRMQGIELRFIFPSYQGLNYIDLLRSLLPLLASAVVSGSLIAYFAYKK